jgi:TonB family protein
MRKAIRVIVLVCLFASICGRTKAQADHPWIEVASADDLFRISMPIKPVETTQISRYGPIGASAKLFDSTLGDARYAVWALNDARYSPAQDVDEYLDACAELIWEDLLKSARDQVPVKDRIWSDMAYSGELPANPLRGREYSFTVGTLTGAIEFFVAKSRIYILLAGHAPGGNWEPGKFFTSFASSATPPTPPQLDGDPPSSSPAQANTDPNDYNRVFSGREVTQKVRVLEKPEPTYTEGARKFGVQGTVILRCVFSKNGEVTDFHVVRKLPHGLTQQSIKAARAIRFTPAMKDGQPVSMFMELQYNYNLY